MLEGGGFEVIDLGTDVSPENSFRRCRSASRIGVPLGAADGDHAFDETTIEALKSAGLRDQVRVLVGGAPVTEQWAKEIGADGYGSNAAAAVPLARSVLAK